MSAHARRELIELACEAEPELRGRVRAAVVASYPWRFALRHGVRTMYRGVRSWSADGAAETTLAVLNLVGPFLLEGRLPPTTAYLEASPSLAHVSSTLVRDELARGGSVEGLVPAAVLARVRELYTQVKVR